MNIFKLFKKDYKRQVITILRLKEELLVKYGISDYFYISHKDFGEVNSWTSEFCKTVIDRMRKSLKNNSSRIADTNICPWCVMYLQRDSQYIIDGVEKASAYSCSGCGYGNRHGNCIQDEGSTYYAIRNLLLVDNIKDIPGLLTGIKKILKGR